MNIICPLCIDSILVGRKSRVPRSLLPWKSGNVRQLSSILVSQATSHWVISCISSSTSAMPDRLSLTCRVLPSIIIFFNFRSSFWFSFQICWPIYIMSSSWFRFSIPFIFLITLNIIYSECRIITIPKVFVAFFYKKGLVRVFSFLVCFVIVTWKLLFLGTLSAEILKRPELKKVYIFLLSNILGHYQLGKIINSPLDVFGEQFFYDFGYKLLKVWLVSTNS
jgi:hypothetical protein